MIRVLILATFLFAATAPGARAATEKALLHAKEGVASLLRGKYEQAIASYDEALQEGGLPDLRRANVYNDRGVAKWRLKRTADAIADFNKAIEILPDYAVVYNNRGNALMDMNRPEVALADFERATTLAPAYGAAFNNLGNTLFALGRYDAALKAYGRAIELMPTSAVPLNGRGKTETALGRPFAGLRVFSRAISLNQKYAGALGNRGQALASLERYSEAIEDFTQALAQDPESAALYIARAQAYAADGKHGPALRDLTRAIDLKPGDAAVLTERGVEYARLKQYKPALEDLSQAIMLKPDDAAAYVHRASALRESGAAEEGLADIARALEIAPNNALALKVRGDINEALGKIEEASADYRAALAADATLADARAALRKLTGEAPAIEVEIIGSRTEGWTLSRSPEGRIIATNPDFPKARVTLEMYGKGEPRITEWKVLKNQFRGIGLLRYEAGVDEAREGAPLQYVAIVDLWKNAVLGIEPFSWGTAEAQWEWREASVVVTDREGVASEVMMRRPQPRPEYASEDWFYNNWQSRGQWGQPPQRRVYRAPQGGGGGAGIFDWLFGR